MPVICAIHCAVTPLIIGTLAALGAGWIASGKLEWSVVALSGAIGPLTLVPGYGKHRRRRSLLLFAMGMGLIVSVRSLSWASPRFEIAAVMLGACFIALAHAINRKLCDACPDCGPSNCDPLSRQAERQER